MLYLLSLVVSGLPLCRLVEYLDSLARTVSFSSPLPPPPISDSRECPYPRTHIGPHDDSTRMAYPHAAGPPRTGSTGGVECYKLTETPPSLRIPLRHEEPPEAGCHDAGKRLASFRRRCSWDASHASATGLS